MKKNYYTYRLIALLASIYFVSQFMRASLGIITSDLQLEFNLDQELLGRLGGIFFLTFALAQIPLGICLDAYNPIKIIILMLVIIVFGTLLIVFSINYNMLFFGRAFQGIGCGVCLMGPLVLISRLNDEKKFSEYSGYVMGIGGLGALVATKPLFYINDIVGWKTSFLLSNIFILFLISSSCFLLRYKKNDFKNNFKKNKLRLDAFKHILCSKNFLLMLPMSFFGYASFAFLLTLWGNEYLFSVRNITYDNISIILMVMAFSWTLGSFFYGTIIKIYKNKKIIVVISSSILILLFLLLLVLKSLSVFSLYMIFGLIGFIGAYTLTVLSHYRSLFDEKIIGKVLTTANLFNFTGVFFLHWCTGFILHFTVEKLGYTYTFGFSISFIIVIFAIFFSSLLYLKIDEE